MGRQLLELRCKMGKKKVLITGGNSGIGLASARLFKERGYEVFISGRNAVALHLVAEELAAEYLVADMADLQAVEKLAVPFSGENDSGLDVLVNNAATAGFMPITALTPESFDHFFHTNLLGPMTLIKSLIPALEKRQGSIVNVSSIITRKGIASGGLYAATKGGLEAFCRCLALELAPRKIRVNSVAPGAIDTPIIKKTGLSAEEIGWLRERQEANIPLHRYGTPEEVAQVIVAQAEAVYVTGAVWTVAGGVDA